MSRNKRIVNIPMMANTRKKIAFATYASTETLIHRPSSAAATEASKLLAIMTAAIDFGSSIRIGQRTDAPSRAVVSALAVIERIQKRHADRGAWEVSKDEARTMRAASSHFDAALAGIPFNVYEAARIFVEQALAPVATIKPEPARSAGSNQGES